MGSEGYLINEFIATQTNQRDDEWGGTYENRIRFPLEIVRRTRARVGKDFIIIFRLSMLDLVEGGSTKEEVVQLAQELEKAGVTILNTGIGWHEARIPTIATKVPRAAFAWVTEQLQGQGRHSTGGHNRINTPDVAENILASGQADMVSMIWPSGRPGCEQGGYSAQDINTCIGATRPAWTTPLRARCLLPGEPRACHETILLPQPLPAARKGVAVVGAGPAGLAFAKKRPSVGWR